MLTPNQRKFLEWIRDNEHHIGEVVGDRRLRLRGKRQFTVMAETMAGIRDFYEPGDYDVAKRMFVVTPEGTAALSASC